MEFREYAERRIAELDEQIRLMQNRAAEYAQAALDFSEAAKRLKRQKKQIQSQLKNYEPYHGDELGEWGARRLKEGIIRFIR